MTNDPLYDALEICLETLEQGGDVEACLAHAPELADELRPILETVIQARSLVETEVPVAAMRRGKARFLQVAAEMREQALAPRRSWQFGRIFRLAFAALSILFLALASGTGLVRASSGALPGDNLYSVKRGWEDLQLFITVNPVFKAELAGEFDRERVEEANALIRAGRRAQINFRGIVVTQQLEYWDIADLRIKVSSETQIEGVIAPGAHVEVWGQVDDDTVQAERIQLLMAPLETSTPRPALNSRPSVTPQLTASSPAVTPTEKVEATATDVPIIVPSPTYSLTPTKDSDSAAGDQNKNSDSNDNSGNNENSNSNNNDNKNDNDNNHDSDNSNHD